MNKPIPERVEEFAKNLSASVRKFAGYGQYPDDGVEQKAYRDGVETAIGMMYIDITGTPKTSGMLVPLLTETDQQARASELELLAVHLDRQLAGYTNVSVDSVYRYIEQRKETLSNPPSQV